MTEKEQDCDFPADDLDRWVCDQRPPDPSPAYLSRCMETIPQPGAAKAAQAAPSTERYIATDGQVQHAECAAHGDETGAMAPRVQERPIETRSLKMKRRLRVLGIGGALASAAALLLVGSLWLTQAAAAQKAAEVLARCAAAVSGPSSVHIVVKMRTPPNDNFGVIDTKCDLVPIEAWRQFGDQPRWRLEEPGRVVVMNGESTTQLVRPNIAMKIPHATYEWGPVLCLTDVQAIITRELCDSLAKGWDLKLVHESTAAGEKKLVVTVETKAGLPDHDYLKNKYLDAADARRVYRFDAKTRRLEGMEAYLHEPGGDVLVLSVEHIEYDKPIDRAVFALKLPEDVQWVKELERLPGNEKYEAMTPLEAARAFFEACAREDWEEVQKFTTFPLSGDFKKDLGGLTIVHLGKPFQSKGYAGGKGWYIPYEIKLKSGEVKKYNLAMRNDNRAHRYELDGGI
jgi:outer membrane lipoprotein-sorting protein